MLSPGGGLTPEFREAVHLRLIRCMLNDWTGTFDVCPPPGATTSWPAVDPVLVVRGCQMSSVSRVAKATVMAVGISILCLLPPLIHFVTGPLGPAIGGYLAGSRMKLSAGQALFVGLVIGLAVGALAPIIFVTIGSLSLSTFALVIFGGFAGIYALVLSGAAAYFGGNSARKDEFAEFVD